jgi:hypothetical protein
VIGTEAAIDIIGPESTWKAPDDEEPGRNAPAGHG